MEDSTMLDVVSTKPKSMLTTTDNPFDPFTQFDAWQAYDESQGYYTCEYLARIVSLPTLSADASLPSPYLSNSQEGLVEAAIDQIIDLNILGIYKKVTR